MQAWRITKKNRALDRSGFGASIAGQRWNSVNVPAIYAGLTLEIAALENLVHTGSMLPIDLVVVQMMLPDEPALFESPLQIPYRMAGTLFQPRLPRLLMATTFYWVGSIWV